MGKRQNLLLIALAFLAVCSAVLAVYLTSHSLSFTHKTATSGFANLIQPAVHKVEVPILLYHYIEIVKEKKDTIRQSLAMAPALFDSEVATLKRNGYTFVFMKEVPTTLDSQSTGKFVALTFDDGYRDFYTDAFPILKKYGAKSTIYVITNFVGGPNYMTKAQLKEVVASGLVEVGSHTLDHYNLNSTNKSAVVTELTASKKVLEETYGVKVVSFAYPYGLYNVYAMEQAKIAGYTTAVTTQDGIAITGANLLLLSRVRPGKFGWTTLK